MTQNMPYCFLPYEFHILSLRLFPSICVFAYVHIDKESSEREFEIRFYLKVICDVLFIVHKHFGFWGFLSAFRYRFLLFQIM